MRNKAGEIISNSTKIESVYSHGIDFMVGDVVLAICNDYKLQGTITEICSEQYVELNNCTIVHRNALRNKIAI